MSAAPEPAAPRTLALHVAPAGPASERTVAELCARHALRRDADAGYGAPAAVGECAGGDQAIDLLVSAAVHALDDTDLHLTLHPR